MTTQHRVHSGHKIDTYRTGKWTGHYNGSIPTIQLTSNVIMHGHVVDA